MRLNSALAAGASIAAVLLSAGSDGAEEPVTWPKPARSIVESDPTLPPTRPDRGGSSSNSRVQPPCDGTTGRLDPSPPEGSRVACFRTFPDR